LHGKGRELRKIDSEIGERKVCGVAVIKHKTTGRLGILRFQSYLQRRAFEEQSLLR
jgi:hypothetical protein